MIKTVKLKNGINIVLEQMPHLRSVCFGIWVRNGARHETRELNGISHFIEHMLFKGTSTRNAKQIADEMDKLGGQINAYTTRELTCFYTKTLDYHFNMAVDILHDMFFNSLFSSEEIEKEKNVILEEISMYEDMPEDVVADILFSTIYKEKSLGLPILGPRENIKNFTQDDFKNYFKERYTPSNITLSIAGNFDENEVIEKLSMFEELSTKEDKIRDLTYEYNVSNISKKKDIEQVHIQACFESFKMTDKDLFSLSALNAYLGGGMSSRLFQSIREDKGLCYSVYSFNQSFVDTGVLSLYASTTPKYEEKVKELMINEIKRLKTDKIKNEELINIKEQIKSNYILTLESSSSRMSTMGKNYLLTGKTRNPDDIIKDVDKITIESFYETYERVFDLDKISVATVGPSL